MSEFPALTPAEWQSLLDAAEDGAPSARGWDAIEKLKEWVDELPEAERMTAYAPDPRDFPV